MFDRQYITVAARYVPTGTRRCDGNPLIEALPAMEMTKEAILDRLQFFPDKPTAADRKKSEVQRIVELGSLNDFVYGMAIYQQAGLSATVSLREALVSRHPLTVLDSQRRHAIAMGNETGLALPANWRSTAKGQMLIGITGGGKSTFGDTLLLPYKTVIVHSSYKGQPFDCKQIPVVTIRIPHDGTLRSLCLQFFGVVDAALGKAMYLPQAKGRMTIAAMALLIVEVATTISLSMLFIDEFQNLRAANSAQIEFVLNMITAIMEVAGVSVLIAGTPALESVITPDVRSNRKLITAGEYRVVPWRWKDPEMFAFMDELWARSMTKKVKKLSDPIRRAWFDCGVGNPAFMSLGFYHANATAIGGTEEIDELSFERVLNKQMAVLKPAIDAIRTNNAAALLQFDDLIFNSDRSPLLLQGWPKHEPAQKKEEDSEEFEEVEEAAKDAKARASHRKNPKAATPRRKAKAAPPQFPTENPLRIH